MFNTICRTGAVEAGAASRYGSGSDRQNDAAPAPAPQHCSKRSGPGYEKGARAAIPV
jgi:hypothetical protein